MKKWIRWGLVLLLLLSAFIAFLPKLLAQQAVRSWIMDELLAKEGIDADVEQVELGWFSPTRVKGISLGPMERPRLLSVEQVRSDRTFWKGITEGIEVGNLTIDHPRITLWFEGGKSNLEFKPREQLEDRDPSTAAETAMPTRLRLAVKDAELWLKTDTMPSEVQVFGNLDLNGTLSKDAEGRQLLLDSERILDHAPISPELCQGGLKYILPILAEATWTRGEFSIEIEACVIDLDDPRNSLVSGKLHIHGIEAGIKNDLISAAGDRIAKLLGRDGLDTVHLAENSVVQFQVRDGLVWHEGVEIGLPKVSPDLVVRTSGSVSFDEELALRIDVPVPLLTNKSLVLHATGTLSDPQVQMEDEDFLGNLLSSFGDRLAEEERPLQSVIEGISESLLERGDDSAEAGDTPILDRIRERRTNRNGPLRRLFGGGEPDR